MPPTHSIIIPFHRDKNMLYISLRTLKESISSLNDLEVIIVANNINEQEIDIEISDKRFRIIQISENLFYPKAINLGVKYATGKYLTLCDPDIFYSEGWFDALERPFHTKNRIGCVGAKLLNPFNNRIMDYGIGYLGYNRCHILRGLPYQHEMAQGEIQVSSFCGAILRIEEKIFRQIGGMNEEMPYAFCDNDFTLTAIELGYKNIVVPEAIAYHKSYTDDDNSKSYAFKYLREDSAAAFYFKHKIIPIDYQKHLNNFWTWHLKKYGINKKGFVLFNLSTAYNWKSYVEFISDLGLQIYDTYSFTVKERNISSLILTNLLPNQIIDIHTPIIYFVDNFTCLFDNSLWFSLRDISYDLIIDRDANIIPMLHLAKMVLI
jgi:GT2 family glycosyltransferase